MKKKYSKHSQKCFGNDDQGIENCCENKKKFDPRSYGKFEYFEGEEKSTS